MAVDPKYIIRAPGLHSIDSTRPQLALHLRRMRGMWNERRQPWIPVRPSENDTPTSETKALGAESPAIPRLMGVLSSPGYRNRKGALERTRRVLTQNEEIPHIEVANPVEVGEALKTFEKKGIEVVCVNGGDGTLAMVLTLLLRNKTFEELPLVAALRGGRTNMSHGDVGLRGDPSKGLKRLIAWSRAEGPPARIVERPVLSLRCFEEDARHYGLFVGAAAIYQASQSLWDKRGQSRMPGIGTVLGTVVEVSGVLTSLIFGGRPFDATKIRAVVDGKELEQKDFVALFITTLERMALGSTPFWGEKSRGPLRLTSIAHEHRRFLRAALAGLRGRPSPYLAPEFGFESISGSKIELYMNEPVTLDGEVFRPISGQPLLIEADRKALFVKI